MVVKAPVSLARVWRRHSLTRPGPPCVRSCLRSVGSGAGRPLADHTGGAPLQLPRARGLFEGSGGGSDCTAGNRVLCLGWTREPATHDHWSKPTKRACLKTGQRCWASVFHSSMDATERTIRETWRQGCSYGRCACPRRLGNHFLRSFVPGRSPGKVRAHEDNSTKFYGVSRE
jgi:hypothetical protein